MLWARTSFRVCADAAANRLRDSIQDAFGEEDGAMVSGTPAALRQRLLELQHVARQHESMVPDAVTGDFDSIREDVLEFYKARGCTVAHNPSQERARHATCVCPTTCPAAAALVATRM